MTALCGWAGLTSIQLLTYSNQEPTGSVAHGIRQPPQCRALLQRNVRVTMHQAPNPTQPKESLAISVYLLTMHVTPSTTTALPTTRQTNLKSSTGVVWWRLAC